MSAADQVLGNAFALGCVATGLALSAASLGVAVWRSRSFAANLRFTERYGPGSPFEFTLITGMVVIFCIACAALVFRPDLSDSERFRFGIGVALFGFLAVAGVVQSEAHGAGGNPLQGRVPSCWRCWLCSWG